MAKKSFFNWSGGKDSALALYHLLDKKEYSVEKLLTNISSEFNRVSMHGVREKLLDQQAEAIGISLQKLMLPHEPSMLEYEKHFIDMMNALKQEKFTHSIFGDIFLEDLKVYRETQLDKIGMKAVFPLWKKNTRELIHEFIELGFKTIVVCVNENHLDKSFCGRIIDEKFIDDLPKDVDVCGENGEFHTFVFDGPIFKKPVLFSKGEIIYKTYAAPKSTADNCFTKAAALQYGFYFCDLLQGYAW